MVTKLTNNVWRTWSREDCIMEQGIVELPFLPGNTFADLSVRKEPLDRISFSVLRLYIVKQMLR